MNTELPLYQGTMPQAAEQRFAQVPDMPRMQMQGDMLDNAIASGLQAFEKYTDLHDFGVRQESEHAMRENELEMQKEFEKKSQLAPGKEGSFFNADGHLDEDAVAAFTEKWQQRNREVARPYWKRENAMRGDDHVLTLNDKLASDIGLGLMRQESRHRAAVFKDNLDLAVAQDDIAGACCIVDDAVASGQLTDARGKVMKLGLTKKAVRSAGERARRGGRETAAQFLQHFYDGFDEGKEPGGGGSPEETSGGIERKGTGSMDTSGLTGIEVDDASAERGGKSAYGFLDANPRVDYDKLFGSPGVLSQGVGALSDDEWISDFRDTLGVSRQPSIKLNPSLEEPISFTVPPSAPEHTQAYMAKAQSTGGMSKDELRRMCYSVAWQMVEDPDYSGLKDADLQKAIIGAITVPGAEDLFFAEAENPELSAQSFFEGVVHNVMSTRDSKLSDSVDGALQGRNANAAIEKAVKSFNPDALLLRYPDPGKYVEVGRGNWKNREKEGGVDIKNALEFAQGYFSRGGGYEQDKKLYVEAVRDVCRTAATDAVVEYRRGGGENWAEEQELIQEAITRTLAGLQQDDIDVYTRFNAKREERLKARARKAAERYDSDSGKLKDMVKEGAAAQAGKKQDAQNAKKKAADDAKAEAVAVEKEIHRYRFPVRLDVRLAGGGLRGRIDTDEPTVYIPSKMYDEVMYDLGVDKDSGVACVFGDGRKKFLVKPDPSCTNVEMNAAAHAAVYGAKMSKSRAAAGRYAKLHPETIHFKKI